MLRIWISSGLDFLAHQGNAAAMLVYRAGELCMLFYKHGISLTRQRTFEIIAVAVELRPHCCWGGGEAS